MSAPKIDLIRQALSAAESSIKLARQLLIDLEREGGKGKPKAKDLPGITGMFDGQDMITESSEKHPVPENYASKSILVVGDTLKLVDSGGEKRFKQIEHVKRHKTTGILAKKDGKWVAVTPEGSYKLLPASVAHFDGEVGDEALLQLPANNLQVPYAAVEKITNKEGKESKKEIKEIEGEGEEEKKAAANNGPQVKEEQKGESKEKVEEPKLKEEKKETRGEDKAEAKETKSEEKVPATEEDDLA